MYKSLLYIFAIVISLGVMDSASALLLFQETFDSTGATQVETGFTGRGNAGNNDFWQVYPSGSLNLRYTPSNADGTYYWGGRDLDGAFGGQSGVNANRFIDISNIDTSAYTNLVVSVALSARSGNRFGTNDQVQVIVNGLVADTFEGSAGRLLSNGSDNLGVAFQDFSYAVADSSLVDIRITAWMNGGGESIAIDNIRLEGDLLPTPEPITLLLFVTGLSSLIYWRKVIANS